MSGISGGGGQSFQTLSFGAFSCSAAVATYLWAGNELEQAAQGALASIQAIRLPPGKTGRLSQLRVSSRNLVTGADSTFRVRKKSPGDGLQTLGVVTALSVILTTVLNFVQDDVNSVPVLDGDEIILEHVPGVGQLTGPLGNVLGVMLLTIE